MIILNEEFQALFPNASFSTIMTLQGEVFRDVENRRTQRIQFGKHSYFIKQHFGVGWREIIKNILHFRLPIISAKNEWLALQHLKKINIETPDIIAFGYEGKNPATHQSFLITRELPTHISLEHFCQHWRQTPPAFTLKYKLLHKIADIARAVHTAGINHRDFYICHFLLDLTTDIDSNLKVYLIDLHRAQKRHRIPMRWQIKDLAALYFSSKEIGLTQRDILRFMKKYRNKPLRDILNTECNFWLKVKKRGEKLYRKHAK